MSVEFFGSCSDKKNVSLKEFIEYLKKQDLAKSVYGPFGEEGEQIVFFFPENGILGTRVKQIGSITANRKRFELPVLDLKKTQDQQLKKKILALKSTL